MHIKQTRNLRSLRGAVIRGSHTHTHAGTHARTHARTHALTLTGSAVYF